MNDLEEYHLFNINKEIFCDTLEFEIIIQKFENLIKEIKLYSIIHVKRTIIVRNLDLLKYSIIDFECNEPKFIGILLFNWIYQFYIKDERYNQDFYEFIIKLLQIIKNFYLFCFSDKEKRIINYIKYLAKEGLQNDNIKFIDSLVMVNLQENKYESLSAAVNKIGSIVDPEPLLRNSKDIDLHYKYGHYDLILNHNLSCLKEEMKILYKRFFKLNLIRFPSLGEIKVIEDY
ncbi:MAG: hypothetical protein EU529_12050 [Promethearchaeota archaeon]|nr:MAG: hypothetical protein EU529_12050 [Candidatus Lokiarchaeota archaeon]